MILNYITWNVDPVAFSIPVPQALIPYWILLALFFLALSVRILILRRDYRQFMEQEQKKKHPKKFPLDIGDIATWAFIFLIVLLLSLVFPLEIGGQLEVRWYGICWMLGFVIGYFVMGKVYKKEQMPDGMLDKLLIYMLAFTVVGARLGHCLFYEPTYYLSHPLKILAIWEGGLASHGGAIGILIGLWIYVRSVNNETAGYDRLFEFNRFVLVSTVAPRDGSKKKEGTQINYLWILDRIVIPVCIVGALIRLGNVFNSEIYGTPTTLPWGFVFVRGLEQFFGPNGELLPCHPTGLYEAFFCLVALALLLWMYYKRDLGHKQPGLMFGTFLVIIFGSRIAIEFLKNVQVDFERNMAFDMGQWLSLPFVLVGVAMIVWSFVKRQKQAKE